MFIKEGEQMKYNEETSCVCKTLQKLFSAQEVQKDTRNSPTFRLPRKKVIPFQISTNHGHCTPFSATGINRNGQCFSTTYFILNKIDDNCCAELTLLEPVDVLNVHVETCDDIFSLRTTQSCITIDATCFCSFHPLSPKLINRTLPINDDKK
jgi:spore coat protein Y